MRKILGTVLLFAVMALALSLALADVEDMPGQVASSLSSVMGKGYWVEDYVEIPGTEYAFAALRDGKDHHQLYGFRRKNGSWSNWLKTDKAIPQGKGDVTLAETVVGGNPALYLFLTETNWGEDQLKESADYALKGSTWQLVDYLNADYSFYAEVRPDGIRYFDVWGNQAKGWAYGTVQTDIRYVSLRSFPHSLSEARSKLTTAPSIPQGEMTAQNIRFTGGKKYAVYTGPGEYYLRGGNGKAQVSTNDWIQVFGRENGWILIQYAINKDHMRFGWIPESSLPGSAQVGTTGFSAMEAVADTGAYVTDDPLYSRAQIAYLQPGTRVTWLSVMGSWAYIECREGMMYRGFVPASSLAVQSGSQQDFWSGETDDSVLSAPDEEQDWLWEEETDDPFAEHG